MIVGIDFDNTLIRYDRVFHQVAVERGLIPATVPSDKTAVRDWLRAAGKEAAWTELQGWVYGQAISLAEPFPGVFSFLAACQSRGIMVHIISHKTRWPFAGPAFDLHAAARDWLSLRLFPAAHLTEALSADQASCFHLRQKTQDGSSQEWSIFFEETLAGKLERISSERCDWFIDDLPELLDEPRFPSQTRRILFDPHQRYSDREDRYRLSSWAAIENLLLDSDANNSIKTPAVYDQTGSRTDG